jgi:hypothetical protein
MPDTDKPMEGIIRPDWFYTTAGIVQTIPIGAHTLTEWIKEKRIEPIKCGRGHGFMGQQIIEAMRKEN